jgi:hypothetical protein
VYTINTGWNWLKYRIFSHYEPQSTSRILFASVKLWNVIVYIFMYICVCLSIRPSVLTKCFFKRFCVLISVKNMKDPSKSLTRIPCSVRECQCVFTIADCTIILTMRYNSDTHYTKQHIMLCCIHCLVNSWHLKIMLKKAVQPHRPRMTKYWLRI